MAVVAFVVALTGFAEAASATQRTIGFDNLPSRTLLGNQYASEGVTFGDVPEPNSDLRPGSPIVFSGVGNGTNFSHSQPNVVGLQCGEVCDSNLWMQFSNLPTNVSVWVASETNGAIPITMLAFDQDGNQIASTSGNANSLSFSTQLSVNAPAGSAIGWVVLVPQNDTTGGYVMDDLSFGSAGPSKPDFGLVTQGSTTVLAGQSTTATVTLHRYNGSTGAIQLSASGAPSGVTVNVPGSTTGGDGSTISVDISAAAGTPAIVNAPVTITGAPAGAHAGTSTHSVTIPLSVTGNYDLRARGLYVTQGIQPDQGGLLPSGLDESGQTYTHQGWVDLVAGKKTVVRLYADASGAPSGGIPGVEAVLHAYANGHELAGSPIHPDYGPASLPDTHEAFPAPVIDSELESDTTAYTFTLPDSWANGSVQLVGQLLAPTTSSFGGPQYFECQTAQCQSNNSFTLNSVVFNPTRSFTLQTLALSVTGQAAPVPASQAFRYAQAVSPLADQGFTVLPYTTTINAFGCKTGQFGCVSTTPLITVFNWDFWNGEQYDGTEGIGSGGFRGATFCAGCRDSATTYNPTLSSGNDRPLSSVAHELFHQYGLQHASNECGGGQDNDKDDQGQIGTPWTPLVAAPNELPDPNPDDGIGQLDGVALDTTSEPYKFRANGLNGFSPYMDLMSYCNIIKNSGDANQWVSPQNWENVYHHFATASGAADRASAAAAHPLRALAKIDRRHQRVVAIVVPRHGVQVVSVGPAIGPTASPRMQFKSSTFTLTTVGKGNRPSAHATMSMSTAHIDQLTGFAVLTAEVPAAGVNAVQISDGSSVAASRKRPQRAPKVKVLVPKAGAKVGKTATVLVRWHTTDPEHLKLTAAIDYSADGGKSWRNIFIGPSTGSAKLPSFYFPASKTAQVRVRINDGFNESVATSGSFTAVGAAPVVTILAPASGQRFAGDASISLIGQAQDDTLAPITGKALTWESGGTVLGHGASISTSSLAPGTDKIELVAQDRFKHKATASVVVKVAAVSLRFIQLEIPPTVSNTSTQLQIAARAAIPTTLSVAGKHITLGRKFKAIVIPIAVGTAPVTLHVTATAGGVSYPLTYVVTRTINLPNPPHPPPCGLSCI